MSIKSGIKLLHIPWRPSETKEKYFVKQGNNIKH